MVDAAAAPFPVRVPARLGRTLALYLALTKPRIIELLLVTTVPTMVLAQRGLPSVALLAATLTGGSLAAGGANALNCYLDRDIDAVMGRTARRPLASDDLPPRRALVFGLLLAVAAFVTLLLTTNALAAWLAVVAIVFYVLVYTAVLKRRTSSNIVWGGAAGCMPVLIGWSAVTGSLTWAPLVLFLVIFLWTPPHFWPLAMQFKDDYRAAKVPMLPVVAGDDVVAARIVAYSGAMVVASLVLWPVASLGPLYGASAVLLGGWFLREAYGLRYRVRQQARLHPARLFHGSIAYLTLLFAAVAADVLVPLPFS
ncbi:MAG: heme o synthase [Mycobacteriales bacterium]